MSTFVASLFLPFTINFANTAGDIGDDERKSDTNNDDSDNAEDEDTSNSHQEHKLTKTTPRRHSASASYPIDFRRLSAPSALALVQTSNAIVAAGAPSAVAQISTATWPLENTLKPLARLKSSTNLASLGVLRADTHSTRWGKSSLIPNFAQPSSRARSPPPVSILRHNNIEDVALEEVIVPTHRSRTRANTSDTYDMDADFTIELSTVGNGGLAIALDTASNPSTGPGLLRNKILVGTLGMPTNALCIQSKTAIKERLALDFESVTVFVDDDDLTGHYEQYCKTILWPWLHYNIPDQPKSKAYEDHSWQFYVKVNEAFAEEVSKTWKRDDTIWVHDYHLMLVPALIRKKIPDAEIGFFMHSAFPSSEVFRCLAARLPLIGGLLGADLVAFQTDEHVHHFLQTVSRLLNIEATRQGIVLEDGRVVHTGSFPMGINPEILRQLRSKERVRKLVRKFAQQYKGKKVIVARDKFDNTRGVYKKLLIFEKFLELYPEYRKQAVLVQIATMNQDEGPEVGKIFEVMTRINKHLSLTHAPLVLLPQDIGHDEWLALMSIADAFLNTSLREGMNLTGHEFIICQDGALHDKKHAPLIFSEFAGAASVFKKLALLINPWDTRHGARTIARALSMNDEEKELRWTQLHDIVNKLNAREWFADCQKSLRIAYREHAFGDITSVPRCSIPDLKDKYDEASRRLILLDYEGTLVNFNASSDPTSPPPERASDILNDLASDTRNVVYVMSGRSRAEMTCLFSSIASVGLIVENGSFIRHANKSEWSFNCDVDSVEKWQSGVESTLQACRERVTGSRIEVLETSVYFKYEEAEDIDLAKKKAAEVANHITDVCSPHNVNAVPIENGIYIANMGINRGRAAERALQERFGIDDDGTAILPDFILAIGCSRHDEHVYHWTRKMGARGVRAWSTITVSQRHTAASSAITQGVTGVLAVLHKLAAETTSTSPKP